MERWSYEKYQSPALMKGCITEDLANNLVTFGPENCQVVDLEATGISVKELAETLRSLQNYDSRSWREIKEGCSAPWLYSLIKQLDELSLIDELSDKRSDDEEILRCVADIIQTSVSFLLKRVSSRASVYVNQLDSIKSFLRQASDSMQVSMLFTAESWDHNFAMQGIAVQIAYAYRNLPEILPVWSRILSLSLEVLTGIKESKSVDPLSTENFNTTDLKTIETYALSFVHLVVLSGLRVSTRLTTIQEPVSAESLSGIAVAICGERVLSTAATKLGTPHYLVAIANHQANAISPLIQGIYVEQFHVTYRFVEIIGPLFAKRLKSELRSRIFNYFHEEYGHEHYELETCKALGLDPENVKRAIPLPMSTLYVDAYTVLAERDPLSFMLSIMITEGLLDQHNPFHDRLDQLVHRALKTEAISSLHHKLNDELNHSSLSRLFLADVGLISPVQQRHMLSAALFMLELNFRALEEAAYFYGDQSLIEFCSLKNWDQLNAH